MIRHAWLGRVAVVFSAIGARGATLTTSSSAPTGATIAQPDFSAATFNGAQDFTDNAGPPGQTFRFAPPGVVGNFFITAVTVKGFANTPESFGGNVNTGTWTLTLSSVDANNVMTRVAQETANPAAVTDGSAYVTLALDTPVPYTLGQQFAFDLFSSSGYFGIAKSSTDVYSGGTAMQHGTVARTAADGAVVANAQAVDRTFFVALATPEPGAAPLLFAGAAAAALRRRRCQARAKPDQGRRRGGGINGRAAV